MRLLLFIGIGALGFCGYKILFPQKVTVVTQGKTLTLENGGWTTSAIHESSLKGQFLVVGAQEVKAPFAEGQIALIPMGEVPALEQKFGNFLHCEDDGSFVAMDKVIDVLFVAPQKFVQVEFKKLLQLVFKSEYRPVVTIQADRYKIRTVASGDSLLQLSGITHAHVLNNLVIEREDYRTPGYENDKGRRIFRALSFR